MGGGNMPAFVVRAVAAAVSGIIAFTMLPLPSPDLSLLTPYVQLHGVPHQWASFIWLCDPLSCLVVQPIFGYYSDRCTSCFGRRRPFIVGGALLVPIIVFLIGYEADIGISTGDKIGAPRKPRAIAVFVFGFWILDVANKMLQGPCRALLADLASSNSTKIRAGNTLFAFFMAVGNVLGYSAGSYTHLYRIAPFTKTDACDIFCANLKTCFFISVALLISIMLLAVWAVSEDPYVPEAAVENGATGKQHMVGALKELSKPMLILLLVTFFNWLAWFPFLLFDTDWMGKDIYGGKLGAQLYNRDVRAEALGLMLNSVMSGLASLCIERLARWVGGVKRLWGGMNFLLAVCLALTLVVTHMARSEPEFNKATPKPGVVGLTLATFAVLGAPLAVTFNVPCALASIFYNNSRAGQDCGLLAERVGCSRSDYPVFRYPKTGYPKISDSEY
ncbi:putative sucrose/H+ symporter, plant, MFS transporter superfamily [Helianthus annuus]|uniref:Sucrose/H+ symporter, plant, MFS transporter superfamily n=1 Tax=Helianthus annuus TaxID=4232 RepID=A0A9K3JSE2_HELAN|nr:putative sucrose/H+ symporter, plant, MFS transporter superfamily [Helianthus annuus]KAJ0625524.1 putative sucrose/H+ symporter, plant, MFS transporter superfamily [Helianthus annuus]KAJ0781919.1 putative sucrose/H+ symporter, plant, MFS transporter superfamily [Helianthus annuus]